MASVEPFIGSVDLWPVSWAPQGWSLCQGQLLPLQQYQALFSLISNVYGGDGRTTFGLPNMQGRFPLGAGTLNGNTYALGSTGGTPNVLLQPSNVPLLAHTHAATAKVTIKAADQAGQTNTPGGYYLANSPGGDGYTDTADTALAAPDVTVTIQPAGGTTATTPVSLMPPFVALNYIIAMVGIYPQRP